MPLDRVRPTIAFCALASAALTPFWFGTVERAQWIPLWELWLGLGLISGLLDAPTDRGRSEGSVLVSRAMLPVHAFFALQLLPLPANVLRLLSPGSFAAHFLPDPGDGRWRPISVSPGATAEAWLYVAGLQGLFIAIQALAPQKRRAWVQALVVAMGVLAAEGLWQSRSAHPYWLYGTIPVRLPSGFETALFGPYLNRNHFATVMAVACGVCAGLASALVSESGGFARLLSRTNQLSLVVAFAGASVAFLVTAVASGSRSGALAGALVLTWFALRRIRKPVLVALLLLGFGALALSGASAMERLQGLDIVTSRLAPWKDMTTLLRFFPLFGSGFGTFAATYWPYQRNVTYEFWQYAHNDYLQAATEGGIVGFAALGFVAIRLRRHLRPLSGLGDVLKGGLAAFAIQAAFDFPSHVPANAAVIVCLVAVCSAPTDGASSA